MAKRSGPVVKSAVPCCASVLDAPLAESEAVDLAQAFAAHVVRLRSGFDRTRFVSAHSNVLKTAVRSELVQLFSNATQAISAATSSGTPR